MEEEYDYSSNAFSGNQFRVDGQNTINMASEGMESKLDRKKFGDQSLSSLTIKQIIEANDPNGDEYLTINGRQITQVTFIGVITRIDVQSTHTSYIVEDGTSQISVKIWNSGDSNKGEDRNLQNLKEHMYVRVVGRLNVFKGQKSVTGFTLMPITDFNEITMHFVECIFSHLVGVNQVDTSNINKINNNVNNSQINMDSMKSEDRYNKFNNNNSYNNVNNSQYQNNNNKFSNTFNDSQYQNPNNKFNNNFNNNNSNDLQQKVLDVISSSRFASAEGCFIEDLLHILQNEDKNEIQEAIKQLMEDGRVYTTIDDDHIKPSNPI